LFFSREKNCKPKVAFVKFIFYCLVYSFGFAGLAFDSGSNTKRITVPKITPLSTEQDIANFYDIIQGIKFYYYFDIYDKELFSEIKHVFNDEIDEEQNQTENVHLKNKYIIEKFLQFFCNKLFNSAQVCFANRDNGDELIWDGDSLTINDNSIPYNYDNFFRCLYCISFTIKYMPESFNNKEDLDNDLSNTQKEVFRRNEKTLLELTKSHAKYLNVLAKSKLRNPKECMINESDSRYVVEDFLKFFLDFPEEPSLKTNNILNQIQITVGIDLVSTN
jgi:hypothetical protein